MTRQVCERAVTELVPYARNARTHSEEQIEQIVASIREFGWTNPVLTVGDQVIAGHGRIRAAVKLGMSSVPCIDIAGLSEAQKRALIIADNKLALNAGWDDEHAKARRMHAPPDRKQLQPRPGSLRPILRQRHDDDRVRADRTGLLRAGIAAGIRRCRHPTLAELHRRKGRARERRQDLR